MVGFLEAFFLICGMRGHYFNETCHSYDTHYQVHVTRFKVMGLKVKVTDNIYQKCTFLSEVQRPMESVLLLLLDLCSAISCVR